MRTPGADAPKPEKTSDKLLEWFQPGVLPADVAALRGLTASRPAVAALMALFSGEEDAVLVRLLVLREVGARGAEPYFGAAELRQQFSYLDPARLDHQIGRLRVHGLLAWDAENARYSVSPLGRMVIAALGSLFKHGEDEGADLGYLTAQLAGAEAVGDVSADELQHLLSRLVELKDEFERAILSGSESRIREAARRLDTVWDWVDRGSEVLRRITESTQLDGAAHRVAQRIGQVQSELLRMSGAFQRALNQLESQKVHLGASGLSSTDVSAWLRTRTPAQLIAITQEAVAPVPDFAFVLGDIALDVAEFELVDKLRPEKLSVPLPQSQAAPTTSGVDLEPPDYTELLSWRDALRVAPDGWKLDEAVPLRDYELSSYRLSLLALLGDRESAALEGPVADLARIERRLHWNGTVVSVQREGVAEMSGGALNRKDLMDGN